MGVFVNEHTWRRWSSDNKNKIFSVCKIFDKILQNKLRNKEKELTRPFYFKSGNGDSNPVARYVNSFIYMFNITINTTTI